MSRTNACPLTAVLIDPDNNDHVKELSRQRIKCGWSAEQVSEWMQECKDGKRKHYLYYETTTALPVGSAALTTLAHTGAMNVGGPLPESQICACALYVDPDFRGKSYGNAIMDRRHEIAFEDPKIEKCVLDTMMRFTTLRKWHQRLGYVEYGVPVRVFESMDEVPEHMKRHGETVEDYKIGFFELTRARWEESKRRDRAGVQHGIPTETRGQLTYADAAAGSLLGL